jgi:ribosomal protein S26
MTVSCILCNQSFGSDKALQQHKRNSVAHAFDCTACDRHFGSGTALQQHQRDSPAHVSFFDCNDCDRSFDSGEALKQHIRDSPAHAPSFNCESCDRSFGSEEALKQHIRDSPAHAPPFNCEPCGQSFGSEEALEQHLRDSPAHAASFNCETCDRFFSSEESLQQHLKNSRIHRRPPETPLDIFFLSFRTFQYDPSHSPAKSYARLREHQGWQRGDTASNNAWNRYQDAMESELRMWYGEENSLAAWHALCRAIGVEPLPKTCEQCEEVRSRCMKLWRLVLILVTGCTKDACQYC